MAKKKTATGELLALLTKRGMKQTEVNTLYCTRDSEMDM